MPAGRPAILTFAGTWAAPGTGYPSDVANACADVSDEVPVQSPNTFGPIPPLGPDGLRAPSYKECVHISLDWAVDWTLNHPDRPIIAGGYSQGGEAASRFRMEFEPRGRLEHLRQNWVCGYVFGNPARHSQTTFYGGPATPFDGIAAWRLPQLDFDWCELIEPGDLYGTSARGLAGEIQRDVYSLCTDLQVHDMHRFIVDFVANLIAVVNNLDGDAGDDLINGAERHNIDLSGANMVPTDLIQHLTDKLLSVSGIAAAVAAAIDALIFFCSPPFPTAAHCEYQVREVWPGMTYVGLAVQHVHDWVHTYAERTSR